MRKNNSDIIMPLITLLVGAFMSFAVTQFISYQNNKRELINKRLETIKVISESTGLRIYHTYHLHQLLEEKDSMDIEKQNLNYLNIKEKWNGDHIYFAVLLEFYFNKETANKYNDSIYEPLKDLSRKVETDTLPHNTIKNLYLGINSSSEKFFLSLLKFKN